MFDGNENKKELIDKIYKQILIDLTKNIENAKKENEETRKMQDFIVEKLTVEIMLGPREPLESIEFIQQGIDHYVKLGQKIHRNDILTRLTKETTKLKQVKDPEEIKKIVEEYRKHEKEVLSLLKLRCSTP